MPVTVRLNHAIADGYLVANVFRLLEQEIKQSTDHGDIKYQKIHFVKGS
jgi:chloramphenicol O-acetyltransferase